MYEDESPWLRVAHGNGPIEGPEGSRFVQCHAATKTTSNRTGEPFRCNNLLLRDRVQGMHAIWMCHSHKDLEPTFVDFVRCEPKINQIQTESERTTTMTTTNTNPWQARLDRIQRDLDETARQAEQWQILEDERLARLAGIQTRFGTDEDYEVGTVFYFLKSFSSGGYDYHYTALKCDNGSWYTSGPKAPGPYSFNQLVQFIGDRECWIAREWDTL